jgi:UDP:flavonoid glycosyltransferase YjiC (YdhE family)
VLVTQGTVANSNLDRLIGPTLKALAGESDLVVVATTGGRPVEALGPLPENARVAEYLPYDWLMPKVDLLVTNGGYGTVTQALSLGIPLVQAGTTEDKREVAVRIANSGAGVALGTDEPTPPQIRAAVRRVLDIPSYGIKAQALAREFQTHDLRRQIGPLLEGLMPQTLDVRHLKIAS